MDEGREKRAPMKNTKTRRKHKGGREENGGITQRAQRRMRR
jgi:hypothetical protein